MSWIHGIGGEPSSVLEAFSRKSTIGVDGGIGDAGGDSGSFVGAQHLSFAAIGSKSKHRGPMTVDGLTFTGAYDSGNFRNVMKERNAGVFDEESMVNSRYRVWVRADCEGTPFGTDYRMWYNFAIRGGRRGQSIQIEIMNLNPMLRCYCRDLRPVLCVIEGEPRNGLDISPPPEQWQALRRADFGGSYIVGRDLLIRFTYTFETDGDTVMFAAHVPFSYGAQQLALESLDARQEELERAGVYYRRELVTRSLEGARVDLLTISSTEEMGSAQWVGEWSIPSLHMSVAR